MNDSLQTEKAYINLVINQIISSSQNNKKELWKQRDFESLSNSIEEKTNIILSVSTLKRLWKEEFSNLPQKNTLHALALFLDYKDWYEFKAKNKLVENKTIIPFKKTIKRFPLKLIYIPATFVVLVIALFLIFKSQPAKSYTEPNFSSRKNVSEGLPNTVIFDYDISKYDFDSAFIQQSWDIRRRAEIQKNEKYSTSVYYYPGYHIAKLLLNDQLVKEIPVYITTTGWLSTIQNPDNELIPIYVRENCVENGQMHITTNQLKNYNIDLDENNHSTSFFYVNENFSGDSENFIFETRIKNSIEDGALVCQKTHIALLCEAGMHFVQFSDRGCIGNLMLGFGRKMVSGKNNDLSAFGTDLNQWNNVKIEVKNKLVSIFLNESEIYKGHFTDDIGQIKGMYYQFGGCGSVDNLVLSNGENQVTFLENFD